MPSTEATHEATDNATRKQGPSLVGGQKQLWRSQLEERSWDELVL